MEKRSWITVYPYHVEKNTKKIHTICRSHARARSLSFATHNQWHTEAAEVYFASHASVRQV